MDTTIRGIVAEHGDVGEIALQRELEALRAENQALRTLIAQIMRQPTVSPALLAQVLRLHGVRPQVIRR